MHSFLVVEGLHLTNHIVLGSAATTPPTIHVLHIPTNNKSGKKTTIRIQIFTLFALCNARMVIMLTCAAIYSSCACRTRHSQGNLSLGLALSIIIAVSCVNDMKQVGGLGVVCEGCPILIIIAFLVIVCSGVQNLWRSAQFCL